MGYGDQALKELRRGDLGPEALEAHESDMEAIFGMYQLAYAAAANDFE